MKPVSLFPVLALVCLLGTGCVRPWSPTLTKNVKPPSEAVRALEEGRIPPSEYSASGYFLQSMGAPDCFGVEGGRATGGDLLRTLESPTEYTRIRTSEQVIGLMTPTSVHALAERVQAAAPSSSKFLVASVCQLGKNVSVLTATVWPKGMPTWDIDPSGKPVVRETLVNASTTVLLVTKNAAHVFNGVRTWGSGGPSGGDAPPCTAKLLANSVSWDCGEGVEWDEKKNQPTGFQVRKTYRLPLNGGKVTSTGYRRKL